MAVIREIETQEQWNEIFERSPERKAYILKYNPQCVICQEAFEQYEKFFSRYEQDDADFYMVDVVKSKPISKAIANDLEVTHQSPQLIIVKDMDSVWCDNHKDIELESIQEGSKVD